MEQGEDSATLEAGDSFSWRAAIPHYAKNVGENNARILISVFLEAENDA